jgi:cysteine sulfinate desulfinase/cysteine desulfurase-like protein
VNNEKNLSSRLMDESKNGINKHSSTAVSSAMNVPPEVGMGALRLSLGRGNDISQIEEAAGQIIARINKLR